MSIKLIVFGTAHLETSMHMYILGVKAGNEYHVSLGF